MSIQQNLTSWKLLIFTFEIVPFVSQAMKNNCMTLPFTLEKSKENCPLIQHEVEKLNHI